MKKLLSILLVVLMLVSMLAGCGADKTTTDDNPGDTNEDTNITDGTKTPEEDNTDDKTPAEEPVTIRIGGMTGPTSIGLVKVMEDDEAGTSENDYEFTIAGAADELTPLLTKGELDIAAVPSNLASVLYNNTEGAIKLLAINTLGVVYIAEKGGIVSSVADLEGQTIYATGKGSTPEYVLRYVLAQNGIDPDTDVTIEWKSEPAEIVAILQNEDTGVAMLPQPFVTIAQTQVEGLSIALDLTEEWDNVSDGSMLITGTLVVRSEFAEQYPEALARFLEEYEASTKYANENVEEAAQLVEKFGLFKAAIAQKAIPFCNITFITGEEAKAPLTGYLQVLFDQNPKAIGGALPGDDFYYVG